MFNRGSSILDAVKCFSSFTIGGDTMKVDADDDGNGGLGDEGLVESSGA